MKLRILSSCWASLAVAGLLVAQEPSDPPARVARLNYLDGSVSFRPMGIEDWAPATLNYPLTTGDRLWVDRDSRAELHVGATAIHLAPETAFAILNLDDRVMQVSVSGGTLYLRAPRMEDDEIIEIDTPNGAISIVATGDYRIDVDLAHNATSVAVRSGQAEVSGNGRIFRIRPGRMLQLVGDDDVADIQQAPEPDPWEDWCVGRDQLAEYEFGISETYVAPEMTGAEDLAAYGEWSNDAIYGNVWLPRGLPAGWAPYRCGHWAYILPWGWTWMDDAPWGFAPFHYGRWERTPFGWEWVPGKRAIRPVYAPALVVFVTSAGLSASGAARAGRVTAWIPLGPGEIFHPNYRVSEAYLRRVNEGDQTEVSYLGQAGMTAVRQETFTGGRPVTVAALRIPAGAAGGIKAATIPDAGPSRETGKKASPPPVAERAVFVRHELPPEVRPAVPIRGAQSASGNAAATEAQAAAPSASNPLPPDPPGEHPQQAADPPAGSTVYFTPASAYTPPPPRQQQSRPAPSNSTPPPAQRQEKPQPAPVLSPRLVERHEESRPAPPPAYTPPPQRHEESRPAPSKTDDSKKK